jgi:hypothetical protein
MQEDESNSAPARPDPLRRGWKGSLRPSGNMATTNIYLR